MPSSSLTLVAVLLPALAREQLPFEVEEVGLTGAGVSRYPSAELDAVDGPAGAATP
jgi:hypothetical protein